MKKLLLIIFCTGFLFCYSQSGSQNKGTKPLPSVNQISSKGQNTTNVVQSLTYPLKHDTCLDKKFSIVFYVIQDSVLPVPGVGVATQQTLNALMTNINNVFKRICVSFTSCSTVLIPNYQYNQWKKNITDTLVTTNWYTDKTINIYLPDTVFPGPTNFEAEGYTFDPPPNNTTPAKDVIVIDKYKLLINNSAVVIHLLGHFFGLPHTFDEINPSIAAVPGPSLGVQSYEYADGTNCQLHGDGFCDTEADPGTGGANTIMTDGHGDFYVHPLDNFMSYYGSFRCRFTQEQYNRMAYIILTRRRYLH